MSDLPAASLTSQTSDPAEPQAELVSSPNSAVSTSEPVAFAGSSNIFQRSKGAVREWNALQREITAISATVSKNEWDILEQLNAYRMNLTEVSFKSAKLDTEIWATVEQLRESIPAIQKTSRQRPLALHQNHTLRDLRNAWMSILQQQEGLLKQLQKAPKSIEFYNRIHLARIRKREQEVRESEVARRTSDAKEAIQKALRRIGEVDLHMEGPSLGGGILKLEEAKEFWFGRMQEISHLETSSSMDADEIIYVYRGLENIIEDAPRMAEQVHEVEVIFVRMLSMHEDLATYGKSVIPEEELARMLLLIQEEIPRLWATGSWEKLRRSLEEVSNFVKFYELPVRSELSQAERRKPGMTRALLTGAGVLPLGQLTPLIRTLVSAIDARDKFMVGHSDAVAKVTVQMARKMNWSGEDLEMIEIAALLHDVGKIVIPENVLTKIDPLSPEDWKAIQMHPYHGAKIVKSIEPLNKIAPWIYHHQERWDGSGYPDRVSSKDIPPAARIIAVSEAFTVMTTDQPKRKALTFDQAVAEISRGSGTQFDPDAAGALIQTLETASPKQLAAQR